MDRPTDQSYFSCPVPIPEKNMLKGHESGRTNGQTNRPVLLFLSRFDSLDDEFYVVDNEMVKSIEDPRDHSPDRRDRRRRMTDKFANEMHRHSRGVERIWKRGRGSWQG